MSTERALRAGALVSAAALLLVPTAGASGTASPDTAHSSRLHHVSSGHAQNTAPAKPEAKKPGTNKPAAKAVPRAEAGKSNEAKKPEAKPSEAKPPATSKAKPPARRRKKREEPEDVADPITMHQARNAKPGHALPAQHLAPEHHEAVVAAVRREPLPAPSTKIYVAAPNVRPAQPEVATTTGVSHPDEATADADLVASDGAPAAVTLVAPMAPMAPVAPVTPAASIAPIVRRDAETGDITLAPADTDDAPVAASVPMSRIPARIETSEAEAPHESYLETPVITRQPEIATNNGRLVMPAPLKGSHDVLVHQNLMADDEHLDRIQDDAQLDELIMHHQLVGFPENAGLRLNPTLPDERRVARVWTVRFVEDMAHNFYERFHQQLTVSSAVRTMVYQLHLERVNGNAAAIEGDGASPHLTGQAVDIAKSGMNKLEIAWMRSYLLPLMQDGRIDVEEEFKQACFHISVYKSYLPAKHGTARAEVAQVR